MSTLRSLSLLVALAFLSIQIGCTDPSSTDSVPTDDTSDGGNNGTAQLIVGFSQAGAESGWRLAETKSIQSEAEKRGIDLKTADGQGKQEKQISDLNTFIAQGVDAIILAPIVKTGWDNVLKRAKREGIPVVLVDRGVEVSDESLYTTLIASDFVEEGRMAAEWLAKKLDGKGNIVELQGTAGSDPAIERKRGFEEGIASYPEMKITKSQTGDFERGEGKKVMGRFLKTGSDEIDAVYAHNDDMAIGAILAIEEAGKKPGTDILVVSIDGMGYAFEAIVEGKLNCTVECNPLLGPAAFDAVEKVVAGEELQKRIIIEDKLFDQSNAKDVIDSRKY